jgi:hypothetical protein
VLFSVVTGQLTTSPGTIRGLFPDPSVLQIALIKPAQLDPRPDAAASKVALAQQAEPMPQAMVIANGSAVGPVPMIDIRLMSDPFSKCVLLTWPAGTLQQADLVTGPYTALTNAASPYVLQNSSLQKFYRLGP